MHNLALFYTWLSFTIAPRICADAGVCVCVTERVSSGLLLLNCLPGECGNLESNECSGEARPPTIFRTYSRRTRRY